VYFMVLVRNSTVFTPCHAFLAPGWSKCTEVGVCDGDRLDLVGNGVFSGAKSVQVVGWVT
jgi:hypothetical protein